MTFNNQVDNYLQKQYRLYEHHPKLRFLKNYVVNIIHANNHANLDESAIIRTLESMRSLPNSEEFMEMREILEDILQILTNNGSCL